MTDTEWREIEQRKAKERVQFVRRHERHQKRRSFRIRARRAKIMEARVGRS